MGRVGRGLSRGRFHHELRIASVAAAFLCLLLSRHEVKTILTMNCIITLATGYRYEQIRPFFVSARRGRPNGNDLPDSQPERC